MISTSGRKILMQFVSNVKTLLTNNITSSLQQHYGIWADGRVIPVGQLTTERMQTLFIVPVCFAAVYSTSKIVFRQTVRILIRKRCNSSLPNKPSRY